MTKQYMHFFEIRQAVSVTDQGSVILFSNLYTFASVERLEPGEYELSSVSSLACGGNGPLACAALFVHCRDNPSSPPVELVMVDHTIGQTVEKALAYNESFADGIEEVLSNLANRGR